MTWGHPTRTSVDSVIFEHSLSSAGPYSREKRERKSSRTKWSEKWKSLGHVWLFATPRTLHGVPKSWTPLSNWTELDYTVHGILQARILEWVAFPFSRGSQPRDQSQVSRIAGGFFTSWTTRETQVKQKGSPAEWLQTLPIWKALLVLNLLLSHCSLNS